MELRIYGGETEYGLILETQDRLLRPIDPGMLFNHLETALRSARRQVKPVSKMMAAGRQ
jgi:hypothetical protein